MGDDLDDSVELMREVLRTTPDEDPLKPRLLDRLGYFLFNRYIQTRAIDDLDEAILIARQAVNAPLEDELTKAGALLNFGIRIGERYKESQSVSDFDEALLALQQAGNGSDSQESAGACYHLGKLFRYKFQESQALADIDEAIRLTRLAVAAGHEQLGGRLAFLSHLDECLYDRYLITSDVGNLEEAIEVAREALDAAPEDHEEYPRLLINLGIRLGNDTNTTANLEEAIRCMRQAVDMLPGDHPGRAMALSNLGFHLGRRCGRLDTVADLDEAIRLSREAVEISPADDPERAMYLNNLGTQLNDKYLRSGNVASLNEAIQCSQEAVDATPEGHPDMVICLSNLGAQLGDRYARTTAFSDLEEAIQSLRRAVNATPRTHQNLAALLTLLASQLSRRYSRTNDEDDLEEAIRTTREALDRSPEGQPDRMERLDLLAILLDQKYLETGMVTDLKEAILVARQAVIATPQEHPIRANVLNNLGDELGNLYLRTGDMNDLEEAITYLQQAADLMSPDNPNLSAVLGNLGDQLNRRYSITGMAHDRRDAIAHYETALHLEHSFTLSRIWAGRSILDCAPDWQQAYEAASLTVDLIPRLSSRSIQNSDRRHTLGQVVGLASDVAAVALQAGQTPLVALRHLEQGRGVLGASMEEVRSDMLSLRDKEPELAEQFVRVRDELETGATTRRPRLDGEASSDVSLQALARRRYEARKEFDRLVAKIHSLPGFADFLLPPSEADIRAAARCGPVVVINVSKHRCDALLVETHQVRVVPLPQLSKDEVQEKAEEGNLESYEVLEWLWDKVTGPILHALGFGCAPPPSEEEGWPRVWWIPTGPLSKFPLHAAGYHHARSGETVLDRVMSSYASSIRALTTCRQRQQQQVQHPSSGATGKALLVAMEHTPGKDRLPSAPREVGVVRDLCESMSLQPVEPSRGNKEEVEACLRTCRIFHFAGHGGTDARDAGNSRLVLADGALHVSELLEIRLADELAPPFLAYLSACGTGRIRDEKSVDESVHLMSAFQLAGFRHVVGTLWSVVDDVCVDVARLTYRGLRDRGLTDASVCRGLHDASRALRDLGVEEPEDVEDGYLWSERDAARGPRDVDADHAGALASWAPYVHFGV